MGAPVVCDSCGVRFACDPQTAREPPDGSSDYALGGATTRRYLVHSTPPATLNT